MTKIKVLMRYLDLPYNKSNISSTFGRENRECAAHTALENLFFFSKKKIAQCVTKMWLVILCKCTSVVCRFALKNDWNGMEWSWYCINSFFKVSSCIVRRNYLKSNCAESGSNFVWWIPDLEIDWVEIRRSNFIFNVTLLQ